MIKKEINLEPKSIDRIQVLCGYLNSNITFLEESLDIEISGQDFFMIVGAQTEEKAEFAANIITSLYKHTIDENGKIVDIFPEDIAIIIHEQGHLFSMPKVDETLEEYQPIKVFKNIKTRSPNQTKYIKYIQNNDVVFGVGPAGTGKTFLAVTIAIKMFLDKKIKKIILTRPAVESGESLGFLPGDIQSKLDPYMIPLYDSIKELIGQEKLESMREKGELELAPLAYMRGRTIKDAFIILDEAQNTTKEQMKMFLTRLGIGSKMVVNGDITQVDLDKKYQSGLVHVLNILSNTPKAISIHHFNDRDIIRHSTTSIIVQAYDKFEASNNKEKEFHNHGKINQKQLLNMMLSVINN